MKLEAAITGFTRQLAPNVFFVHTSKTGARDLRAFARWLGENPALSAITPDDLARFLTSDAVLLTPDGSPRKPITINRTKSALRSFFAFCVESVRIKDNSPLLFPRLLTHRCHPALPQDPGPVPRAARPRPSRDCHDGNPCTGE